MGELLPFLMFGILFAAMLSRPLKRWPFIPLPLALVFMGFVSSEIWVAMGRDTGLIRFVQIMTPARFSIKLRLPFPMENQKESP